MAFEKRFKTDTQNTGMYMSFLLGVPLTKKQPHIGRC